MMLYNRYRHHHRHPSMSIQRRVDHQELINRRHLLDGILSTHNAVLEFDRATGYTKVWPWYPRLIFVVRLKT